MWVKSIGLATVVTAAAVTGATAQTKVSFALDWKFEGPSAAYFAAIDNGHFKAEGLDVEISAASICRSSASFDVLRITRGFGP